MRTKPVWNAWRRDALTGRTMRRDPAARKEIGIGWTIPKARALRGRRKQRVGAARDGEWLDPIGRPRCPDAPGLTHAAASAQIAESRTPLTTSRMLPSGLLAALVLAAIACSPSPARETAAAAREETADSAALAARRDSAVAAEREAQSRLLPVDSAWVERTLASLSLREKVGQMVLAWSSGPWQGAGTEEMRRLSANVERDAIGGVIISIGSAQDYVAKLNALQRRARVPLLMVTDMESGPGMRLTGEAIDFPPVMGLAATGSDTLAFEVGKVIGETGRAVGLGLTLSPVLDVNANPLNPIINTRSFGEDPALVGRFAAAYVRGVHAGGLLAAGKHVPGHGDTRTDSHIDLPRIDADRARLDSVDLPPFRAAVQAGIDGMLVGHIAVPRVTGDDRLASLSVPLTTGILRREMGFEGLVFTDAMNMGALTRRYGQGEAAVLAVLAGADLLLQPTDIPASISAVVAAVESGRIPRERIDASVRRILAAKTRVGLHTRRTVDAGGLASVIGSARTRALADSIARRSITLARDRGNLVPLSPDARRILSITYTDGRSGGARFNAVLSGSGRQVETAAVTAGTGAAEYTRLRARADAADVVVVSAYITPREYQGTVEAGGRFATFVEALAAAGKPVVVVSFGSPYLIRSFPSVGSYMLGWGREAVLQEAGAGALLGRIPITGRLPVTLPGTPRGGGLTRPARGQ